MKRWNEVLRQEAEERRPLTWIKATPKWAVDTTFVPARVGWLYLAAIPDL